MALKISRGETVIAAALLLVAGVGLVSLFQPPKGKDTIYNEETVAIMRRVLRPDSNGVDVGAFEGTLTKPMTLIAPRGMHYAVEPQPAYAKKLRARFPQVKVLECALGDAEGTAEFTLALDDPAYSGFKAQAYPSAAERMQKITVRVARLDDVVPPSTPVAFMKVDVEGAEFMVLSGAKATIRRGGTVIAFEYGKTGIREFGTTPAMMWKLLHEELGLELALMRTWLDGGPAYTWDGFRGMVESGDEWMFVAYPPAAKR